MNDEGKDLEWGIWSSVIEEVLAEDISDYGPHMDEVLVTPG